MNNKFIFAVKKKEISDLYICVAYLSNFVKHFFSISYVNR